MRQKQRVSFNLNEPGLIDGMASTLVILVQVEYMPLDACMPWPICNLQPEETTLKATMSLLRLAHHIAKMAGTYTFHVHVCTHPCPGSMTCLVERASGRGLAEPHAAGIADSWPGVLRKRQHQLHQRFCAGLQGRRALGQQLHHTCKASAAACWSASEASFSIRTSKRGSL